MPRPEEGPAAFLRSFDVSRETVERLARHAALLEKWNRRINLVGGSTVADIWSRHIADSAQLWPLRPERCAHWVDLGSGAGFPGLVIAALAAERRGDLKVTLVEADSRKAAFLWTAAHELGLTVEVCVERHERLAPMAADVVSARALAPLGELLAALEMHRRPGGIGLFPKGETVHKEIADASMHWRFDHRLHPSQTDPRAAILEIGATERV